MDLNVAKRELQAKASEGIFGYLLCIYALERAYLVVHSALLLKVFLFDVFGRKVQVRYSLQSNVITLAYVFALVNSTGK